MAPLSAVHSEEGDAVSESADSEGSSGSYWAMGLSTNNGPSSPSSSACAAQEVEPISVRPLPQPEPIKVDERTRLARVQHAQNLAERRRQEASSRAAVSNMGVADLQVLLNRRAGGR